MKLYILIRVLVDMFSLPVFFCSTVTLGHSFQCQDCELLWSDPSIAVCVEEHLKSSSHSRLVSSLISKWINNCVRVSESKWLVFSISLYFYLVFRIKVLEQRAFQFQFNSDGPSACWERVNKVLWKLISSWNWYGAPNSVIRF